MKVPLKMFKNTSWYVVNYYFYYDWNEASMKLATPYSRSLSSLQLCSHLRLTSFCDSTPLPESIFSSPCV